MVTYPVSVPRDPYRGRNPSRLRKPQDFDRLAEQLERYINERVAKKDDEIQEFLYGFIAIDLGIEQDRVRDVLFGVDCGHNALLVQKIRN
jgi:hypothetical protein